MKSTDHIFKILLISVKGKEEWVKYNIAPTLTQDNVELVFAYKDIIERTVDTSKREALKTQIDFAHKIILILSPGIPEDDMYGSAIGYILSNRDVQQKICPVVTELCDIPEGIDQFHSLLFVPGSNLSQKRLFNRIFHAINQEKRRKDLPHLIVESVPRSPVPPYKRNLNEPSDVLPNCDHEISFRIYQPIHDFEEYHNTSTIPYAVDITNIDIYEDLLDGTIQHVPQQNNWKYVKYWPVNISMQEIFTLPTGAEVQQSIWIRLKNGSTEHCRCIFRLTFALKNVGRCDTTEYISQPVVLQFVTSRTKPQIKKYKSQKNQQLQNYTSSSEDDWPYAFERISTLYNKLNTTITMEVPLILKRGFLKTPFYYKMMRKLQLLGENPEGNYEAFYSYVRRKKDIFEKDEEVDGQIVVLIEECGVEHYRNNLKKAKQILAEVNSLLPKAENSDFLLGRLLYYLNGIQRKEGKLGLAHESIMDSKKYLYHVEAGEDTAEALFNEARSNMELISKNPQASRSSRLYALELFKQSIEHYKREGDFCDGEIRRCLINMTQVYLGNPTTKMGRFVNNVTAEDIKEAENCITLIKELYYDDVTKRTETHIALTESGLYFRKGEYGTAIQKAEKARKIAEDCEFEAEIKYCSDFIDFLSPKHRQAISKLKSHSNLNECSIYCSASDTDS